MTPRVDELTDRFGNEHQVGLLGIERQRRRLRPARSRERRCGTAGVETWNLVTGTLRRCGRWSSACARPTSWAVRCGIAQMSSEVAQDGVVALIWFMAVLSVNLGLINLFPIPGP